MKMEIKREIKNIVQYENGSKLRQVSCEEDQSNTLL